MGRKKKHVLCKNCYHEHRYMDYGRIPGCDHPKNEFPTYNGFYTKNVSELNEDGNCKWFEQEELIK